MSTSAWFDLSAICNCSRNMIQVQEAAIHPARLVPKPLSAWPSTNTPRDSHPLYSPPDLKSHLPGLFLGLSQLVPSKSENGQDQW